MSNSQCREEKGGHSTSQTDQVALKHKFSLLLFNLKELQLCAYV